MLDTVPSWLGRSPKVRSISSCVLTPRIARSWRKNTVECARPYSCCSTVAGGAAILGAYRLGTVTRDLETMSIPNLHLLTVEHTLVYAAALVAAAVLGWVSRRGPATSPPAP